MSSETGAAEQELSWVTSHEERGDPKSEKRHAINRVPVPPTEGAAAALPKHVASLPYLNEPAARTSTHGASTPSKGAFPAWAAQQPSGVQAAPLSTPAPPDADLSFADASLSGRMCRQDSTPPMLYATEGYTQHTSALPMPSLIGKPYLHEAYPTSAPLDTTFSPSSADLSRARQPSSGSIARSFNSEEESRFATPATKPLSVAANRVAGTFSRLTRLRTRQNARTSPAPQTADPDVRSEREDVWARLEHTQRPDPALYGLRAENTSATSIETANADPTGELSYSRHTRGASERSQASSGSSLAPILTGTTRDTPATGRSMTRTTSRSELNPTDGQFQRLELIGRGAYGAVYRGKHLPSNTLVALKVIDMDTPDDDVSEIRREVALLSQMRQAHTKNIVRYWGCWLSGATLCIAMDYAEGGSIRTLMKAGPVQERHLAVVMRETLVALDYIHKAGIIHRDIKAANILVTRSGQPMLCDFGVAASFVQGGTRGKRSTLIGTPYWMAPEVISEGRTYDYKADIWSLGITAIEIATGNPPHAEQDQQRVIAMIPKSKPPRLPEGPYSPALREFVAACLDEDANARLPAEELSRTKFIRACAKTPTSVLRELLAQYASWTQAGGVRTSLIQGKDGPLALHLASEEPSAVPIEPEWNFGSMDSDDVTAPAPPPLAREPLRDHPLNQLFSRDADENDRTPKPPSSGFPTISPSALAPAPYIQAPTQPKRPERPAGAGFSGSGATPFRFGMGSRADPKEVRVSPFDPPPLPRIDSQDSAPSHASRSPSVAAIDETVHMDARTTPSTSSHVPDLVVPSLSQPNSPEKEYEESEWPRTSPALRRVGRMPVNVRTPQQPTLRQAASSSSLGNDSTTKTPEEGRKKMPETPSFLEEPFIGFRPQGVMSRTRSRSGSAADLRTRNYLHHASHSLTSRTRIAPMQLMPRLTGDQEHGTTRKETAALPASASLSVLPKPEKQEHQRNKHGGSDPLLPTTPRSEILHAREASDPSPQRDESLALPPQRALPIMPDAEKDVFHTPTSDLFEGPPLCALDLANLMNREELHTELMQTVNDLGRWLDTLSMGLATVLAPPLHSHVV